jgi:hypothetical protein
VAVEDGHQGSEATHDLQHNETSSQ